MFETLIAYVYMCEWFFRSEVFCRLLLGKNHLFPFHPSSPFICTMKLSTLPLLLTLSSTLILALPQGPPSNPGEFAPIGLERDRSQPSSVAIPPPNTASDAWKGLGKGIHLDQQPTMNPDPNKQHHQGFIAEGHGRKNSSSKYSKDAKEAWGSHGNGTGKHHHYHHSATGSSLMPTSVPTQIKVPSDVAPGFTGP